MDIKTKSTHNLNLKDKLIEFDPEKLEPVGSHRGSRNTRYHDFKIDAVAVIASDGRVILSRKAHDDMGAPERVQLFKSGDLTAIRASSCKKKSSMVSGIDRGEMVRYISHRRYVQSLGFFIDAKNGKSNKSFYRYYHAAMTDDGYLIFDHTFPYETEEREIIRRT